MSDPGGSAKPDHEGRLRRRGGGQGPSIERALAALCWPVERVGEAVVALARRRGLAAPAAPATAPRHPPTHEPAALDRWMAAAGDQLGITIEPMTALHREVDAALAVVHPAVLRLTDDVLVVLGHRRGKLSYLAPDGVVRRIARRTVVRALQASHEAPHRSRIADFPKPGRLKMCRSQARDRALQTLMPRTLFPCLSSRGEKTPMPSCPGRTATIPPATPLFAGRPTS